MQQGISLIELLIVLAVTGILAAIAYPGYNDHLRQAARHEVVALLQDAALRLERHRLVTGQYAEGDPSLPSGNRYYSLQALREDQTFTLRARRLSKGLMAEDRCGDFELDQAGVGRNHGAIDSARCWGG